MQLTDTLSGTRKDLLPPVGEDGVVRMYVCGITPYSEAHVGHALHAIVFDTLRRYLDWRGIPVRHVQNFTDIDDKLIERSNRLGIPMAELAERNIAQYLEQLRAMNVLPAHVYPRVTQVIPQIIRFIEGLIEKGYAYASGGDVYYRVRAFGAARYGALARRDIDDLRAGARVDPTEHKDDPLDFALWKAARPGEPSWESPWGPGRPGWHIECSAMALETLGEQIDIHGGGMDLIFPHHTNEIAQTEAYTGKAPFARIWMHNALLQLGSEKMSKSIGNLVSIQEALDRYGADALRLFVITSHYRSPVTYSEEALEAARAGAERLRHAASAEGGSAPADIDHEAVRARFIEAMDDDLNTPRALAALFELARDINRAAAAGADIGPARATLRELCGVLGLTLEAPAARSLAAAPFIDLLVEIRAELRAAKQWALADRIRERLASLGIELQDSADGTTWSER
ncbi:MAG: cysteine--tRNA ligase [Tepidiforma sp.]|uniref:cysteine--tRNA ligase n=1 Tax=Tepidiforma sp. TaxID=2682230 RepID=UPI0021DBBB01|nr:cysteine--tRNA ligase [Tepidiforma sp.]GIW14478.1 MAG: cysteine--tRNA ligase [Tepidiforma sp.]